MITLHQFQHESVMAAEQAWRTHRRVLLIIPTGGGKTICATEVIKRELMASSRSRVMLMAHRIELISQAAGKLRQAGLTASVIKAGYVPDYGNRLQVASVQTFRSRFKDCSPPPFDLIVFDEVHRREYEKTYAMYPNVRMLGLTATPERLGGKTLCGEYDHMHVGIGYASAIAQGFIVHARPYTPPSKLDISTLPHNSFGDFAETEAGEAMGQITGDIIQHWHRYADNLPTILFACSIAHGQSIERKMSLAGITCVLLTGETSETARAAAIAAHESGDIRVIINVGLFTEGLDLPWARCVIMARPTMSLALYLQMAGRGCRSFHAKDHYVLLDHAGNIGRHGLPDVDRPWSLEPNKRRSKGGATAHVRICPACFAAMIPSRTTCPYCDTALNNERLFIPEQNEGELALVSRIEEPMPDGAVPFEKQRRRYFYTFRFQKLPHYALLRKVNDAMSKHRTVTWRGQRMALPLATVIDAAPQWPKHTQDSSP